MQDCKDGSGLQFIRFDFMTGGQGIKIAILVAFWNFSRDFYYLVNIFCFHHFWQFFSSHFKIIKQAQEIE